MERPARAMFVVRGAEAADFLQGQVSNDVEGLAPGQGCYATILNHKGKLRTDLRILRGVDFFWLDTDAIGHAVLRHMLVTYSLGRDVRWEDTGAEHALLSLIGPAADDLIEDPPPAAEHSFVDTGAGLFVRTDLGIDLLCSTARAEELRADLGLEEVSEEVAECLRIESGRPRLGLDMDADTIPQEAGINERAVDFDKGCYVGQETVARLHHRGKPNRHLRGLRLSEPAERRRRDPARREAGRPHRLRPASRRGWADRPGARAARGGARRHCAGGRRGGAGRRAAVRAWLSRAPRPVATACRARARCSGTTRSAGRARTCPPEPAPARASRRPDLRDLRELVPARRARSASSTTGAARSGSWTLSSRCSTSTTTTGSGSRPRAWSTCPATAAR